MPSPEFLQEMDEKRGTQPVSKLEFIDKSGGVTDITRYYVSGANMKSVRERAPDEIQAGQFDVTLSNHDDLFSEFKFGSILYGGDYHSAAIRISQGFVLPDGTVEYETQGVGYIDTLSTDPTQSLVTFRCRDLLWRIMDQLLHVPPPEEVPQAGGGNIGNGVISSIHKLPFVTVTQDFTLTCTTPGVDNVADFSVVGSVSGSIGPAVSGVEFAHTGAGVKFRLAAGSTPFQLGDTFTFSVFIMPQWHYVNAGKIVWAILTGYNWDTDTQEPWSRFVFDYDHTKSSANVDLDYDSFVDSIDKISLVGLYDLKGFVNYSTDGIELLQSILLLFLGSIYSGNDGRIVFRTYLPVIGSVYRTFSDKKKIMQLSVIRTVDEVINAVSVRFQQTDAWPFTDVGLSLDGMYAIEDAISISKYKKLGASYSVPWKTTNNIHVQDFAAKLIGRFNTPPINVEFETGMDGLMTQIGDRVLIDDDKNGLAGFLAEISMVTKAFDNTRDVSKIGLRARRDSELGEMFGYIGSEIDEGDGLSPQSDDYDTATTTDREFAYFSKDGETEPDYRIF